MRQDWAGRFKLYDSENPHVYQAFVKFAREMKAATGRCSAAAIWERLRWESTVTARPEPGLPVFRLNNSMRAFYARKLEAELPDEFRGAFEKREQKSLCAA